ncbi:unnamed protein product [Leuciscus chuanchicus]
MNLLLLLLCFISYSGSSTKAVSGIKGGNFTLSCGSEDREIVEIRLYSRSKIIRVCEKKNCSGRVFKEGSCDVFIKDLIYSDAGKYFLHVYYTNDQTEVKRQIREYHLHIHDEISVKKGEDLKLDVLLINADKVERNSSEGWTEVWTRGHGVNSDRLTVSDETLIINEFTDTDTGTYRVLDYEGETLITVSVTDWKGNLIDTDEDKTDDTEHRNHWMLPVGLTVFLLLVILLVPGVLVILILILPAVVIYRCHLKDESTELFSPSLPDLDRVSEPSISGLRSGHDQRSFSESGDDSGG